MVETAFLPETDETLAEMLAPARTALIVIDIQKDFAAPDGRIGRLGVNLAPVEEAIDQIEGVIAAGRAAGATIGFMRVVTSPESDRVALKTLMRRRGRPGGEAICREADGGAAYYRVQPKSGDIEISKLLYNSFHGTDLDDQLRRRGVDTLLIAGVTTDCCVDATARDAFHRDYHVFILRDGCAAYEPQLHAGAIKALEKNCALIVDAATVRILWSE